MNYEFHVGDYVERCNGSIGYLTVAKTWYSEAFCEDAVCLRGNTTVDASCGFTPFAMTIPLSDISKYFNYIVDGMFVPYWACEYIMDSKAESKESREIPQGWLCPRCKRIVSPFVNYCDCED